MSDFPIKPVSTGAVHDPLKVQNTSNPECRLDTAEKPLGYPPDCTTSRSVYHARQSPRSTAVCLGTDPFEDSKGRRDRQDRRGTRREFGMVVTEVSVGLDEP